MNLYKKVTKFILVILSLILYTTLVFSSYNIPWQGVVTHPANRTNVFDADITVNITDKSSDVNVYNKTFVNKMRILPDNRSGFEVLLGEDGDLGMVYNNLYSICFSIQNESQGCFDWKPGLGNITGNVISPNTINYSHIQWDEFNVSCDKINGSTSDLCTLTSGSAATSGDVTKNITTLNSTHSSLINTLNSTLEGWIDSDTITDEAGLQKNITTLNITLDTKMNVSGGNFTGGIEVSGNQLIQGISTMRNVIPETTEIYDIGGVSNKWNNFYTNTIHTKDIYSDLVNTSTINTTVANVEKNLTIGNNKIIDESGNLVVVLQ